jgi:hypothetical protein
MESDHRARLTSGPLVEVLGLAGRLAHIDTTIFLGQLWAVATRPSFSSLPHSRLGSPHPTAAAHRSPSPRRRAEEPSLPNPSVPSTTSGAAMRNRRRSTKKQPEPSPPSPPPAAHAAPPMPSPSPKSPGSPAPEPAPAPAPEVLVPADWASAAASISSDLSPPVVLVCGPANSGKSTFSRLLVNSLLPRWSPKPEPNQPH